ncbi:hypothetical protein LY76DRAFT_599541 [Colletotrichum caudatum]|nr:hypothetical protein LY76DRAFT_599541 [Colletotrichum caudatum]
MKLSATRSETLDGSKGPLGASATYTFRSSSGAIYVSVVEWWRTPNSRYYYY